MSEDDIIQRHFAPLAAGFPGAFGLTDDCAVLSPEPGHDIVATTDAVIEGVHFLPHEDPAAIAWKALAVNVSDLAAKGAEPLAYLMALALPAQPDDEWFAKFAGGLRCAQMGFRCFLAGGDTDRTPGPLAVTITAFGTLPWGSMVRRSTARAGDLLYVTGSIGDAALGLRLARQDADTAGWPLAFKERDYLVDRFRMPVPIGLGAVLRAHGSAAIDISDGLIKDCARLCAASGLGARIEAEHVPLSPAARAILDARGVTVADLVTGGEDYEILFSVPAASAEEFERADKPRPVTRIGCLEAGEGVTMIDAAGGPLAFGSPGWDHFV